LNSGPAAWIVGNWQISGTIGRESGLPFGIGTTSSINAGGQADSATQINPSVKILGGTDAGHPYFDGSAFINPPNNVLGSTGHYLLFGPGYFQMNANVSRIFRLGEKASFKLQGEAYNLTNTVVFSNPGGSCCWAAGATTSAGYNGFGVISATQSTPRYLVVAGYLRF
jgi:hypothetical protein